MSRYPASARSALLVACLLACADDPSSGAGDADSGVPDGDAADPGGDDSGAADEPDAAHDRFGVGLAGFTIAIDPAGPTLELSREQVAVLRIPADGLQLGLVESIRDGTNYDPYGFFAESGLNPAPPLQAWTRWSSAALLSAVGARFDVAVGFDNGQTATLRVRAEDEGRFSVSLVPDDPGRVAFFRIRLEPDPNEGLYGLGEVFDSVNHRGYVRAMQLEFDAELESANNEAHVPVPILLGTTGWGLFVEDEHPAVFDVAAADPSRIDAIFATAGDSADGLRFHLFAAEHPLDLTRHYYEITGYPAVPAPWALGPWIWRDESRDQAEVESDAAAIRALDLATTAYWIDRPYATGVNTFDFEAVRFPDPARMFETLHGLGFEVALWHTPYLDESDPSTQALRDVGESEGYYPLEHGPILNGWGRPIDFTNPDAAAWWQANLAPYIELGVAGFKLDYGEDVVLGLAGSRSRWLFADGSDERTMHAGFQRFYHRTYAELLPEDGGFLLCRGGTFGDQVNASVIWPGDLEASFARHREEIDGRHSVGGLPAALVAALSLGPSGFPLFGSDTGGYRHSPPDRETFTRWFQITALSTVMQVGTSSNDVPWEFNAENGFDEEMLGWYRNYARLHLRLHPYLWTHVENLRADGRPIQRALGLAYPELGVHPSDTFLLGDDLLVAPVVERGARNRALTLPPGDWVDWWSGARFSGPGPVTVEAPLDTLPLFLRAGALVPLLRPTIDTLSPAGPEVESLADDAGRLTVVSAVGPGSRFNVYDGTDLEQRFDSGTAMWLVEPGSVFVSGTDLEVIGFGAAPAAIEVDGASVSPSPDASDLAARELGWRFATERGGTLYVRLPAGPHRIDVDTVNSP